MDNRRDFIKKSSMLLGGLLLTTNKAFALGNKMFGGNDPFVGEIAIFSFPFAPRGWAKCDGQLLPIINNVALFALLGTTYGGDGRSTFALPDLRGRAPLHYGEGIVLGKKAGAETHVLTTTEMPLHDHQFSNTVQQVMGDPNGTLTTDPINNYLVNTAEKNYSTTYDEEIEMISQQPSGGGQPHNNMQLYLVLNFCIATQGIFPSQS